MGTRRDSAGAGDGQPEDGRSEGVARGAHVAAPICGIVPGGAQKIPRPPTIRLGAAAPWAGLPPESVRLPLDEVRRRCLAFPEPKRPPHVADVQAAAVLVP